MGPPEPTGLIASMLASPSGGVAIDVTVNGSPIGTLLQQLCTAWRDQQEQLHKLQEYTYNTDQQQWARITELEARVARIDTDLASDSRPISLSGVATDPVGRPVRTAATTAEAVRALDAAVSALERNRRGAAMGAAVSATHDQLRRTRFLTWVNWAKARHAAAVMRARTLNAHRAAVWHAWQQFVAQRQRQKARARHVEGLLTVNDARRRRGAFQLWRDLALRRSHERVDRRRGLVEAAERMRAVTYRGMLRGFYLRWLDAVASRRFNYDRQLQAARMAALSNRALVRRYFVNWRRHEDYTALRRRQRRTADALSVQSARIVAGRAFLQWIDNVRRHQRRRLGANLVPRLFHDQCVRLTSRYFAKLWRHAVTRRDTRARDALHAETADLSRRFDALSGQVHGTRLASQEALTALERLSRRVETGEDDGHDARKTAGLVPDMRSASAASAAPAPASSAPSRAATPPASRSGQAPAVEPAALQLGSHVTKVALRGGGSGEITHVADASHVGRMQGPAAPMVTTPFRMHPPAGRSVVLPTDWVAHPEAAWQAVRDRVVQQQQQRASGPNPT